MASFRLNGINFAYRRFLLNIRNVRQTYGVLTDKECLNVGVQSAVCGCSLSSVFGCCSLVGPEVRIGDKILQYLSSSSSFYWASVANASNVPQPYWLIVLPLDVPDLTASLLL